MSVRLLGRAFYADLLAHLKLTLLALCDEASEDGSGICIGQARLAKKVGATDRTVRSNLAQLGARGWISKLPEKNAKYRTDQWEIDVEMLPHGPETSSGRRAETSSGPKPVGPEAERPADRKPSVNQTGSGLPPTQELPVPTQTHDPFDEFWTIYPRKVGKGAARRAFKTALKKTDADTILAATTLFARQVRGVEPQFVAHPATWLNAERWDDEEQQGPSSTSLVDGLAWAQCGRCNQDRRIGELVGGICTTCRLGDEGAVSA